MPSYTQLALYAGDQSYEHFTFGTLVQLLHGVMLSLLRAHSSRNKLNTKVAVK